MIRRSGYNNGIWLFSLCFIPPDFYHSSISAYMSSFRKKKDRTAAYFLASCLSFAFWNLAYAAMTISRPQYHVLFQKLGYIGAGWYEPFLLLFFIRVTGYAAVLNSSAGVRRFFLSAVFVIPALLSFQNLVFNNIAADFPDGFWYLAHQIGSNIYNVASITLQVVWLIKTDSQREKKQALLIISGAVITIVLTTILDFRMGIAGLPTLTPFLTLIWGGSIFYAFNRFDFLKTSPVFMSARILEQSPDMILMFDRNLKLLFTNYVSGIASYEMSDNERMPGFETFFSNSAQLIKKIKDIAALEIKSFTAPVVFRGSDGENISLQGCFSLISDEFDSFGGILFSGRALVSLGDFSSKWKLSPRETEVLKLLAAGSSNADIAETLGIAERTVKTHVSNILYKTRTDNRLELARMFASGNEPAAGHNA